MKWNYNRTAPPPRWSDLAETVRDSLDISEVIQTYTGQTPKKGMICCPFHNEKTPSFSIYRAKQMFHCFGCQESGDVISFTQKYFSLVDRKDAILKLGEDFNLNLPIGRDATIEEAHLISERREQQKLKSLAEQAYEILYRRLWDEWIRLDIIRSTADPSSEEYAYAVKNIDRIANRIDTEL